MRLVLLICLTAAINGCSSSSEDDAQPSSKQQSPWFIDVASDWGVDFIYDNGFNGDYHVKEVMGGAPALFDFDNDGDLDLYVVQGDSSQGNMLFENMDGQFIDITNGSGADNKEYGIGVSTGDFDNDGFTDLYVTNVGLSCLLRNNGDGTFQDVTDKAGVGVSGFSGCSAFGDLDQDGDLDLVVTRYLDEALITDRICLDVKSQQTYCNPIIYKGELPDVVFINNGDGTFQNMTEVFGLSEVAGTGLGVFIADLSGDNLVDVFIANDGMPDRLWVSKGDGTFVEDSMNRNIAIDDAGKAKAGMGATPVDFDQDGDFDVYVTNVYGESDSFFRNEGDFFQDMTRRSGLSAETRAYTRWGIVFSDFNNDSAVDLYISTGGVASGATIHSEVDPLAEPNLLFEQVENGRFNMVEPKGGTSELLITSAHGVASGDIDGDGGVDLVVVNSNLPLNILRNVVKDRGHWISIRVLNEYGSDAIGASVKLELENGEPMYSEVMTSTGYASGHDPSRHFGLGAQHVKKVVIQWPDGSVKELTSPEMDTKHTVKYGE